MTEKNPLRSPGGILPIRAMAWYPIHTEDMEQGCFWIHYYTHIEDDDRDRPPTRARSGADAAHAGAAEPGAHLAVDVGHAP